MTAGFPFGIPAPEGWRGTRLREFLSRRRDTGRTDLPLLSVNRPNGVVLRHGREGRMAPSRDMSKYQTVQSGNLVMNQLGKPHGSLGVSPLDGIISPAYFVCRIGPTADPHYVHHLLRTRLYIAEYERRGKNQPPSQFDISWSSFREIPVTLPPLRTQRKIADFLDRETERIDALVDKKRRLIDLLEEKRTATITQAVTKGLNPTAPMKPSNIPWIGEIPKHWQIAPLRRVAVFVDYRGKTPRKTESGTTLVTARNIRNGQIDFSSSHEFIRPSDYTAWMVRGFPALGDVLITTEAPLGSVAQIDDTSIALAQRIVLLKAQKELLLNDYLALLLQSEGSQANLNAWATGSTALGIKADRLKGLPILIPPIPEQELIVDWILKVAEGVGRAVSALTTQLSLLSEYREALITAAVTGEIDVDTYDSCVSYDGIPS